MNIARTLELCLDKRGISKAELAKRTMLSKSYLSRISNNERTPNIDTLEKICLVLEIPLSVFIFLSSDNLDISKNLRNKINSIFLEILDEKTKI